MDSISWRWSSFILLPYKSYIIPIWIIPLGSVLNDNCTNYWLSHLSCVLIKMYRLSAYGTSLGGATGNLTGMWTSTATCCAGEKQITTYQHLSPVLLGFGLCRYNEISFPNFAKMVLDMAEARRCSLSTSCIMDPHIRQVIPSNMTLFWIELKISASYDGIW